MMVALNGVAYRCKKRVSATLIIGVKAKKGFQGRYAVEAFS